jgi:hypothetical protein
MNKRKLKPTIHFKRSNPITAINECYFETRPSGTLNVKSLAAKGVEKASLPQNSMLLEW